MKSSKIIETTGLRPPLKWAGGKRWLVPYLRPLWEDYCSFRLVEPFCGGLAVALGLGPERALLNDINVHLINYFKWLQKGLRVKIPMRNEKELYYTYRDLFNSMLDEGRADSKKSAELFYYLNRTGYNGLCRFNRKGLFNVPFGSYRVINYTRDFTGYKDVFKNWEFMSGDFEELRPDRDDFIYADPPYDVEFTQYAERDFNWDDQVRLARWLAGHAGPVVLSNQATDRIVALYESLGFELRYLNGPRMISCTGDRTPEGEVVALKGVKAEFSAGNFAERTGGNNY